MINFLECGAAPASAVGGGTSLFAFLCEAMSDTAQASTAIASGPVGSSEAAGRSRATECLDGLTSAAWALARQVGKDGEFVVDASAQQLASLSGAASSAEASEETRGNCVGILGCLASQASCPAATLVDVGRLMKSALCDASLRVVCDALDATMDVFSDDGRGDAFAELQLLPLLQQCIEDTTGKVREESRRKRYDRDHVERCQDVLFNARRFVEYMSGSGAP